jgi:hypothetical protein
LDTATKKQAKAPTNKQNQQPPGWVASLFGDKNMTKVSKEDIIAAIKECAQNLGRAPKYAELLNHFPQAKMGRSENIWEHTRWRCRRAAWIAWGRASKSPWTNCSATGH